MMRWDVNDLLPQSFHCRCGIMMFRETMKICYLPFKKLHASRAFNRMNLIWHLSLITVKIKI